jgi:fosfomycin resistance protein FosX
MIESISHITFIVSNLNRMSKILKTVFDAKEVYSSDDKEYSISKEKFFMLGELWIAIMEGDSLPQRTYNHVAFKIEFVLSIWKF